MCVAPRSIIPLIELTTPRTAPKFSIPALLRHRSSRLRFGCRFPQCRDLIGSRSCRCAVAPRNFPSGTHRVCLCDEISNGAADVSRRAILKNCRAPDLLRNSGRGESEQCRDEQCGSHVSFGRGSNGFLHQTQKRTAGLDFQSSRPPERLMPARSD